MSDCRKPRIFLRISSANIKEGKVQFSTMQQTPEYQTLVTTLSDLSGAKRANSSGVRKS
jgi:hypothetical protein